MANIKSAEKRHRQSVERRDRNRAVRSTVRSVVKKVRSAVEEGNGAAASQALPEALRILDTSVKKGVVHANTAARTKSRLTRAVAAAKG